MSRGSNTTNPAEPFW